MKAANLSNFVGKKFKIEITRKEMDGDDGLATNREKKRKKKKKVTTTFCE